MSFSNGVQRSCITLVAVGGCDSEGCILRSKSGKPVVPEATTGCANQKPGKAARFFCLVKDINFIDANRLDSCKRSHLSYAMLPTDVFRVFIFAAVINLVQFRV